MGLKAAIGWSVVVHLGLLFSWPNEWFVPPREVLHTIEVTYQVADGRTRARQVLDTLGSMAPKPDRPPATPQPAPSATAPRLSLPEPPVSPRPSPSPPSPEPERVSVTPHPSPPPTNSSGAASLPEGEFAFLEHKQQVRDHLRAHLAYPAFRVQGTVRLLLALDPSGALQEASVLETTDPRLGLAALEGARLSVPYPRFPREMKSSQARYEFLVQYRPE